MAGDESVVFNHVGLCVRDLPAARRFYEELLGFTFVRSLTVPDAACDRLLRLSGPIGLEAVYLQHGGFVLELLSYSSREVESSAGSRTMDQTGLTHLSLTVDDLPGVLARVESFGGTLMPDTLVEGVAVFLRDPDGQLIELLARK